jgi:hypothetical protein
VADRRKAPNTKHQIKLKPQISNHVHAAGGGAEFSLGLMERWSNSDYAGFVELPYYGQECPRAALLKFGI